MDDAEDADIVSLLIDPMPPEGFHVVSTETVHGLEEFEIVKNLQMFTQVWRAKIPLGQPLSAFNQHFNRLLQVVQTDRLAVECIFKYFKVKTFVCVVFRAFILNSGTWYLAHSAICNSK